MNNSKFFLLVIGFVLLSSNVDAASDPQDIQSNASKPDILGISGSGIRTPGDQFLEELDNKWTLAFDPVSNLLCEAFPTLRFCNSNNR